MTQSELSKKIAEACQEVRKDLPEPKSKGPNWSPHKTKRENDAKSNRIIKAAAKKYGISPETIKRIIFKR